MWFAVAFAAGVLTLLSPCVLPVLPFVLAGAGRPFTRYGLPLLVGLALAFTAVASLAAVAGSWAASLHAGGRWAALAVLGAFGLAMLLPRLAAWATRPLVALGHRLAPQAASGAAPTVGGGLLLGLATGLVWAPCAGPVLGLVLGGAMLEGPSARTSLLLAAYAAGAATALGIVSGLVPALLRRTGGRLAHGALQRASAGLRRAAGAAVLAMVALIALGLDARWLGGPLPAGAQSAEEALLRRAPPAADAMRRVAAPTLPVLGPMQSIDGAAAWINSPPRTAADLRGKVVLVDFWTYGCTNCLNALPYVKQWHARYASQGLVIVGVHTPEFAYEKLLPNVRRAVQDLGVEFPVAVDNSYGIWRAWSNRYWPALYLVDAQGRVRWHHIGEGKYAETEAAIRQLLEEARSSAARPA